MLETYKLWRRTNNPEFPYIHYHKCQLWKVRTNDFPLQNLYSILIGEKVVIEFNSWPDAWSIID